MKTSTDPDESFHNLQEQVIALLKSEQFESAMLLGTFLISMDPKRQKALANSLLKDPFVLFGDALYGKKEYRRALTYYERAYEDHAIHKSGCGSPETDAYLQLRIAKCYHKFGDHEAALKMLKSTHSNYRTLEMHMLMGRLYLHEGIKSKAEECFKEVLRINPYAIEASLSLVQLGEGRGTSSSNPLSNEINTYYNSLPNQEGEWLKALIEAHVYSSENQILRALDLFAAIERKFPENLHCLVEMGRLQENLDYCDDAKSTFLKARKVDALMLDGMDCYATALYKRSSSVALNRLSHELIDIDEQRPESWIAAALFSEMKGDVELAVQFCERAIKCDPRFVRAHLLHGKLLMMLRRVEASIVAFTTAHKMSKDILSYKGLVDAYLSIEGMPKYNEAFVTARGAMQNNPRSALAITLYGKVLATRPENKDKAKKAFETALTLDPKSIDASIALADLYVGSNHLDDAVKTLQCLSKFHSREFIHSKLAEVYTLNQQYSDALSSYHQALSLSPTYTVAIQGLDRLEKLMRGIDPDAPQDEEEHDNEPSEEQISFQTSDYSA